MNDYVKSDLMRYYGRYDIPTFIIAYCRSRTFRFQYAFRMCQCTGIAKIVGLLLWELNRTKNVIQLPRNTKVGYGLYIGHGGLIVINSTTIIGPNVCIVENVVIGNNVTIGAGSVVTKDIPDNATAVGNYAKVINYNEPGRYINNRWNVNGE